MDQDCLTNLLNVLFVLKTPSEHPSKTRIILVLKWSNPTGPGDFRSISVTSILLWILDKLWIATGGKRWLYRPANGLSSTDWLFRGFKRSTCDPSVGSSSPLPIGLRVRRRFKCVQFGLL
ncbi:hypothetical protein D915_000523 [Fasciola hepatica]|uniref:Uncharacterized protein n=1 Tax=Fasciola hepatica TaxID=6192 RepID=A0A4E0S445_FASHE|nr:hypothetical protein D915_000523 [Fasciola hepatica]